MMVDDLVNSYLINLDLCVGFVDALTVIHNSVYLQNNNNNEMCLNMSA